MHKERVAQLVILLIYLFIFIWRHLKAVPGWAAGDCVWQVCGGVIKGNDSGQALGVHLFFLINLFFN